MTLNDANYELRSFEMEFMQEVDSTFGEPKTSSRGGFALVSFFQLPDENINNWLVSPDRAKGEFRFGYEQYGYPLKISFSDAQCAGCFAECVNGSDTNVLTRMNIAPMKLSLNGVPYRNFSVSEPESQIKW